MLITPVASSGTISGAPLSATAATAVFDPEFTAYLMGALGDGDWLYATVSQPNVVEELRINRSGDTFTLTRDNPKNFMAGACIDTRPTYKAIRAMLCYAMKDGSFLHDLPICGEDICEALQDATSCE